MSVLKPDLLRLLLNNLSFGPAYADGLIEKLSGDSRHSSASPFERYQWYIAVLSANNNKVRRRGVRSLTFLFAHLNFEAGMHAVTANSQSIHLQLAMAYFQDFLSWESGSPDTRYYAQYRLGVIQRFLGSPWPAVEESLLNAVEFDSLRGEATKEIIEHYLKEHQWRNAYIFSSYAVREFFGKCPSNSRSWFIDTPFYLWQVLDYHVPVCLTLRKKDEALQYLKILQQYAWHHPGELDQEVLTRMDQCAAALTCPAQPAATKTLPIKTFTNETPGHETLRTQFHL